MPTKEKIDRTRDFLGDLERRLREKKLKADEEELDRPPIRIESAPPEDAFTAGGSAEDWKAWLRRHPPEIVNAPAPEAPSPEEETVDDLGPRSAAELDMTPANRRALRAAIATPPEDADFKMVDGFYVDRAKPVGTGRPVPMPAPKITPNANAAMRTMEPKGNPDPGMARQIRGASTILPGKEASLPRPYVPMGKPPPPPPPPGDVNNLEAWRNVAEGLGNIRVTTGAQIRAGLPPAPPFVAEGIRRDIARAEDQYTPEEAQALNAALNAGIRPGMRRSAIEPAIPSIGTVRRAEAAERAAAATRQAGLAESRRKEAKLSDAQVKDITALDKTLDLLQKVRAEKGSPESPNVNTGPFIETGNNAIGWVPGLGDVNPERAAFKARLAGVANAYIHEITGAAASAAEMKRILAALPSMYDDDKTFEAKLSRVIDDMKDYRAHTLENLGSQGKDIEGLQGTIPKTQVGATLEEGGTKVPIYDPNTGKLIKEVFEFQVPEAERRGGVTAAGLKKRRANPPSPE